MRETDFDTLYIVGDLIDIWSLRRGTYWPQQHNDVIQKILRKARKGTRVVFVPGLAPEHEAGVLRAVNACLIKNTLAQAPVMETALHTHELTAV